LSFVGLPALEHRGVGPEYDYSSGGPPPGSGPPPGMPPPGAGGGSDGGFTYSSQAAPPAAAAVPCTGSGDGQKFQGAWDTNAINAQKNGESSQGTVVTVAGTGVKFGPRMGGVTMPLCFETSDKVTLTTPVAQQTGELQADGKLSWSDGEFWIRPFCSVVDGSQSSSSYPCTCGTDMCSASQLCTSATNLCSAAAAAITAVAPAQLNAPVTPPPAPVTPPAPVAPQAGFVECKRQATFNIRMCASHMCNNCILAWCPESCQKLQLEYPTCRCGQWPATRVTFSGGDFEGKDKFGDTGDYSEGIFTTLAPR